MQKFFLTQVQHNAEKKKKNKGVVVKDTLDAARQSFHAYLGAYGYGNQPTIDYVAVAIMAMDGRITDNVVDNRIGSYVPPTPIEE